MISIRDLLTQFSNFVSSMVYITFILCVLWKGKKPRV